jgi:hypothetical protein
MTKKPICKACRKPLDEHLGLYGTCELFQKAFSALCIINAWITVDRQQTSLAEIYTLVQKTIREINEKRKQ